MQMRQLFITALPVVLACEEWPDLLIIREDDECTNMKDSLERIDFCKRWKAPWVRFETVD